MPKRIVSQARSFKENPNHYPRKLKVRIYNALTKKEPNYSLPKKLDKVLCLLYTSPSPRDRG